MQILTDDERCFVDHRYCETVEGEVGPATLWLVGHGILPNVFLPFFDARSRELRGTKGVPAKPGRFVVPWRHKDEFLRRVGAIKVDQRIDVCN